MSSAQCLRDFIRERLTAAAAEIFTEVEKTIVRYEEELDAQRRMMMGINWKPEIKLSGIGSELQRQSSVPMKASSISSTLSQTSPIADIQKSHVSIEEEASTTEQLCEQGRRFSDDQEEVEPQWAEENQMKPEHPLIKEQEESEFSLKDEENEEPVTYAVKYVEQEPEHLPTRQNQKVIFSSQEVQQQSIALIKTSTLHDCDLSEGEQRTEPFSFFISPVVEYKDQEGSISTVSESLTHSDTKKKSFPCDICGKSLMYKHTLNVHKKIHTNERPFPCEICGKSFVHGWQLNVHKRTHTGEKPFSCETCGKCFIQKSALIVHMRTHGGERPYSCQLCGRNFSQIGHLILHKRVHTGEKPFSCQLCGKSFSQKSNLNIHKRTHTEEKPFFCQTCGRYFLYRKSFDNHRLTHTGEKPFSCQSC